MFSGLQYNFDKFAWERYTATLFSCLESAVSFIFQNSQLIEALRVYASQNFGKTER